MSCESVVTPPEEELRGVLCLTVHQPWADLIVSGRKWAENRTWRTKHRGRIGIHAGRTRPKDENLSLGEYASDADLPLGVIVGTVEVVACLERATMSEDEFRHAASEILSSEKTAAGHEFVIEDSPFVWLLANPVRFEAPIPRKGQTLLWKF